MGRVVEPLDRPVPVLVPELGDASILDGECIVGTWTVRLEDPVGVSRSEDPDVDMETVTADITDVVPDLEPYDTIYHLATLNSYGHPADPDASPDVAGTRNLIAALEDIEDEQRPDLVYVSSAAAIDPDPAEDGVSYSEAKTIGEATANRLDDAGIVRPGSVYGDGKGAIAYFLSCAEDGEDLSIYGDGTQERPFVHVDDVVDAMVEAGPGDRIEVAEGQYSFNDVADIFEDAAGIDREYDRDHETASIEITGDWEQHETERSLEKYIHDQV